MKEAGGGERMKKILAWGEKVGAADTLTDRLRLPNTRCCLQPRLARGPGQHNLSVLDNFPAWQLQLDTAPQHHNILLDISESHIFRFANRVLCVHDRESKKERETDRLWGPSIHGNPSQVLRFICNSGNSTYNEKHAYKVTGIQMRCMSSSPRIHIQLLRGWRPSARPVWADLSHNAPVEWQVWYFHTVWLSTAFNNSVDRLYQARY